MGSEFGFKRANFENWLTVDSVWNGVVMTNLPGDPLAGWIAELNAVNLSEAVPVELRKLYEVARAAFIYSVLYYPFLALGSEQMLRIAERAVAKKCETMNAHAKLGRFVDRIDWLAKSQVFDGETRQRWHDVRMLRNEGTHPEDQMILNPALALSTMEIVVELVNELFL